MASPSEGLALSGAAPDGRCLACHARASFASVAATATAQLGRRWLDAIPTGYGLFSAALPPWAALCFQRHAQAAHTAPMRSPPSLAAPHRGTRARHVLHFVDAA
jgi:hypothetical protein